MKKLIFIALMMVAFGCMAETFEKEDGVIEFNKTEKGLEFAINSSVDQSACAIDGPASMIDEHRATYSSKDELDKCTVDLYFQSEAVNVKTNNCESYCGVQAVGSMDGAYFKAKVKKEELSESEIDINMISGNMYVAYYNGGITAMTNRENECWNQLNDRSVDKATECYIQTITGIIIERAVAQQEGRLPVPYYELNSAYARAVKHLKQFGLDKEQLNMPHDIMTPILTGLMNAGMQ